MEALKLTSQPPKFEFTGLDEQEYKKQSDYTTTTLETLDQNYIGASSAKGVWRLFNEELEQSYQAYPANIREAYNKNFPSVSLYKDMATTARVLHTHLTTLCNETLLTFKQSLEKGIENIGLGERLVNRLKSRKEGLEKFSLLMDESKGRAEALCTQYEKISADINKAATEAHYRVKYNNGKPLTRLQNLTYGRYTPELIEVEEEHNQVVEENNETVQEDSQIKEETSSETKTSETPKAKTLKPPTPKQVTSNVALVSVATTKTNSGVNKKTTTTTKLRKKKTGWGKRGK